jgi:hypothetical protein
MQIDLAVGGAARRWLLAAITAMALIVALAPAAASAATWRGTVTVPAYTKYWLPSGSVSNLQVATPNYGYAPSVCIGLNSSVTCNWFLMSSNASWATFVISGGYPWIQNNSGSSMGFDWYT